MNTFFINEVSEDFNFLKNNKNVLNLARQFVFENIEEEEELIDNDDELEIINPNIINTEINEEIEIEQTNTSNLSLCVVINTINGKIQRCNSTEKLKGVWQLVGTWQLDSNVAIQTDKELNKLGVCQTHFMFDQNCLYQSGTKSNKDVKQSIIHNRRCKFCNKNYYFFSRGKYCKEHSWEIAEKQIHMACIAQKGCNIFQEFYPIIIKAKSNKRAHYICCNCFKKQGGHLYVRPEKGKIALDCKKENMHLSETSLVLELMNKWILYVAQNESIDYQEKVLTLITPALQQLNSKFEQPIQKPPSLFVFRYIFNDINKKVEDKKPDDWYHIGLIYTLLFKRYQIANERQKQRKQLIISKKIDSKKVERITTMLSSIILTSSFTNTQFWFTRSLASLCRKKKLSSSLHQVLESVNVVSHSIKHERKLEFKQMSNTDPHNIDFKQNSFSWGNIYDTTRSTSHAILRLVFQFTLPIDISSIEDETIELNEHNFTIGLNEDANKVVLSFEDIILQLLSFNNNNNFNRNFNIEIINKKITKTFSNNSHLPSANIVILEAGDNSNSDEDIKQSCDQYFKDLNISTNKYINICCDKAIFRRIMRYYVINSKIRSLLGMWHTSKDYTCSQN
ncbi:hypothetical protein Glove_74g142 [Diversispora epigaea]|uniref:Uncharacterized protein n=1 Tax=Diversispora epigaea TaxID=1348612 RepID=A0A397JDK6_9GLOM|nr:hypothetical protein Glove_74g142 [Diversispora epigaea]